MKTISGKMYLASRFLIAVINPMFVAIPNKQKPIVKAAVRPAGENNVRTSMY